MSSSKLKSFRNSAILKNIARMLSSKDSSMTRILRCLMLGHWFSGRITAKKKSVFAPPRDSPAAVILPPIRCRATYVLHAWNSTSSPSGSTKMSTVFVC